MAHNDPSPGLAREAIGLREVLFQSITHMAPAAAVAFSIIVGANFAGGALPLSVVLALVGCLLVAVSIGQLARRLPSAGGFATYAARGVRVNALAPALVRTPMSARAAADADSVAFAGRRQPLAGGFLDAADVTEAAVYLCSDDSRAVTGQVLTVDGGWTVT